MRLAEWYVGDEVPKVYTHGRYRMPGLTVRARDGVMEFRMRAEKGDVLTTPPAISLSIDVLNYIEDKREVRRVVVYYQRKFYSASTSAIRSRDFVFGGGRWRRCALEMKAWSVDGQAPGTEQGEMQFAPDADPEPISPLTLGIQKPTEEDWQDRRDIE